MLFSLQALTCYGSGEDEESNPSNDDDSSADENPQTEINKEKSPDSSNSRSVKIFTCQNNDFVIQSRNSFGLGEERLIGGFTRYTFHYTICTKLHLVHFITSSLSTLPFLLLNTYFHLLLKLVTFNLFRMGRHMVVTGFGPFKGTSGKDNKVIVHDKNASWEAVKVLKEKWDNPEVDLRLFYRIITTNHQTV